MTKTLPYWTAITPVAVVAAVVIPMSSTVTVEAHGADGEVQIVGQRVGRLHLQVQLIAPEDLTYISSATVTARARFLGQEPAQTEPVRSRYRAPWYEMKLSLEQGGPWEVLLSVDGTLGQGETSFLVEILPEKSGFLPGLFISGHFRPLSWLA